MSAAESLRVCVVEHDPADVELNIVELERNGFLVTHDVATTEAEFRELLGRNTYDVVLADYRLPGWTGMRALEVVRELGIAVPLILVTGTLGEERAVDCLHKGVTDYILKTNLARLSTAVRRAMLDTRTTRDRRESDRQLRERDERFRQLADNIEEVFFIVDLNFRETVYINPAYERLWGRSRESLYERPDSFFDAVKPAQQRELMAPIERVRQGVASGSVEFEIAHPDGNDRWMLAHAVPVRNDADEVYRIAGFVLDITERKRAQDALLESERRLRALLDTVQLVVVAVDAAGKVEYINPFALRLLGRRYRDVVGSEWSDIFAWPGQRESLQTVRDELLAHDMHGQMRSKLRTPSGEERTINWYNTVLRDGQGVLKGTLSVGDDITKRELLEEQYRQSQKLEAVGQLAGGVAHDFNNLLTVIMSYAELLRESFAPDDQRIEDLDPILKAAEAAAGLTRQLLTFSRQEVIRPRPVNLEDVVDNSSKMLRRIIGEHIGLRTELSGSASRVMIDPGQLEQVIMNLAVNARDAMPDGGTLTISTRRVTRGEGDLPASFVALQVSDTGTGMDDQTRARIFEPFFTTKEVGKGTGLGLATVYGIVKQAAGTIEVSSTSGLGTTFRMEFPVASSGDDADLMATTAREAPVGTETILLVEDAAAVRAVARRVLERAGYTVLEATNGTEALRIAETRSGPIHLLLTDVIMPGMSGRKLADAFIAHRPDIRVLFMSGYTDDTILHHGVLSPDIDFIKKPFTNEALASEVRRVLDKT